jgi:hypothetical protein
VESNILEEFLVIIPSIYTFLKQKDTDRKASFVSDNASSQTNERKKEKK